jgi:ACS family hexuronate transporter-like MFS transporter
MAFLSTLVGYVLQWTGGSYAPLFVVCGLGYLLAFLVVHSLAPKLNPAEVD